MSKFYNFPFSICESRFAMHLMRTIATASLLFIAVLTGSLQAQVSVTATAGTPGPTVYTTLKDAFDAVNAGTHQGVITVSITANTTEPVTGAILNASGGTASYTAMTISPSGGTWTISGAITAGLPLIDLNGADNVTINGLNSGGNSLTIANTTASATANTSTIRFIGDASMNTITNCTIQGSSTATTTANIHFSTGTTTGNDGNTISNSDIGPAGANFPANCVYSIGTSISVDNSGNSVTGCNIFDFFSAGSATTGILVSTNNSGWTVTSNKIYQTATRTYTTGNTHRAIVIASGSGNTVSNNTIGFASNTGTGVYTMTGTLANRFIGIDLAVGTTPAVTSVQNNTIAGFLLATSSGATTTNGIWCGINVTAGNVNIGTVTGNTIGSGTGNGSITTTCTTTGGLTVGINSSSTLAINISNNTIGSITANGSSATISASITGIQITAGVPTVTNNLIGSNSTALSLQSPTVATTGSQLVFGINVSAVTGAAATTISGNTVSNLFQAGTTTTAQIRGISYGGTGFGTLSLNTVKNLAGATTNVTVAGGATAVIGILHTGTSPAGASVTQNTVSNIACTNTGAVATVTCGIGFSNPSSGTVTRNTICDIKNASTGTTATAPPMAIGILIRASLGNGGFFSNNMITLGTGQTTNTQFVGMMNSFFTIGVGAYYNSVHIEGTAASGALPSYCFHRGDNTAASAIATVVDIRNNIFNNTRTGGTGKHYAIANTNASPVPGWAQGASNNNVLNSASAATVGLWGAADQTFASWKTTTGCDFNSYSGITVTFTDPATCNLHLNMGATPTPMESGGSTVSSVAIDFDNQARPGPPGSTNGGGTVLPDIGADEFDGVPMDLTPPNITFTPLSACSSGDLTLAGVTIQDFTGVPISGTLRPRIYYRKGAGSYFSQPGTLSSGTGMNGTWSFTIVVADMGGVAPGDVISYYVIAQDVVATPNIGSNAPGVVATNVNTVITHPATPNTYTVAMSLSGPYNVGAGGDFLTLTAAVAAYNTGCITGPVTFNLTDATYPETFPITIGVNAGASATNRLTIKPAASNVVTISGSSANCIINLNGADFVTIDGSNSGGTDRSLTITNTNTVLNTAAVCLSSLGGAQLGATNNVVKNCNISTGSNTVATFGIYVGGTTISAATTTGWDNDNNEFRNNAITSVQYGIYANGIAIASTGGNDNLIIAGNLIGPAAAAAATNVGFAGIWVANAVNPSITGNTVRNVSTTLGSTGGIWVNTNVNGATISLNNVNNIFTSGSTSGTTALTGIYVGTNVLNSTVTRNTVTRIENTNTGGWGARGIMVNTGFNVANNITIANNMVSDVVSYSDASAGFAPIGIAIEGATSANIYYNSVNLFGPHPGLTSATTQYALFVAATALNLNIRNNIFVNSYENSTSTTEKSYAIGTLATSNAPFSTINNNDYFVSGTSGILGLLNLVDLTSLPAIQAAFGQNANSLTGNPQFISNTDLHISTIVGTPVESAGMTVAGITTDFDGDTRNVSTPDLGADEGTFMALLMNEVQATAFIDPANGSVKPSGVAFSPMASFTNNGSVNQTNVPVRYKIIGPSPSTAVVYNMTTTIASLLSGATATATFPGATIAAAGNYTIQAISELPGDQNTSNDMITGTISVEAPLAGNYNIGASQAVPFNNLTNAIAKLNQIGVSAAVSFTLLADYSSAGETYPLVINQITGGSATNTFTIKPGSGVTATITGALAAGALIKLNGADFVTIDGSNNGTSSRNLTISNTTTTTFGNAVIWLASPAVGNGAINNTIKNCIIEGDASTTTFLGVYVGGNATISLTAAGTELNSNNTINNNLFRKTQYGLALFGFAAVSPDMNNVISNNNFGTAVAGEGFSIGGINTDRQSGLIVSGNEVQNVTGISTTAMFGMKFLDFKNGLAFNNMVHDISYTGTSTTQVRGIWVSSSTYSTVGNPSLGSVYNNFVYKINSSGTSATWNTTGILASTGYGDKYYYNSVDMSGQLNNSTSGLSAAFANGDPGQTGLCNSCDVRNNIFNVTGTSASGNVWAYTTQATTLAGFIQNYNLLRSAGTGATNNTGRFNAVNYVTLANWQTGSGLDINSVAGNPQFISTSNLHISTIVGTPVESAATPISGITMDLDGDTRNATTPDIGADEGTFMIVLVNDVQATAFIDPLTGGTKAQSVAFSPMASFSNNGSANQTNVPVRYKIIGPSPSTAVVYDMTATIASLISGATATATFPSTTIAAVGTYTIQAISELPGDQNTSNDMITGTISVEAPLAGNYNIGASQPAGFQNLTQALGKLNNLGVSAPVTFTLLANYSSAGETFPLTINQITGGSATNTFTIKPGSGVTATISGSFAGCILRLNGADFVTIDGSNSGGTDRSLTISNTAATAGTGCVCMHSLGTGLGATNNTVKNTVLTTGSSTVASTYGISIGGATPGSTGADNDNITIQNNDISKAYYGVYAAGTAATSAGGIDNITINNNIIGPAAAGASNIGFAGIWMQNALTVGISGNTVRNVVTTATSSGGIYLSSNVNGATVSQNNVNNLITSATGSGISSPTGIYLGTTVINSTVSRNTVTRIENTNTGGWGIRGIMVNTGVAASNVTIANNMISDVVGYSDASNIYWPIGMALEGVTGGVNIYYNSVNMFGPHPGLTSATGNAALFINTSVTALDIRDNIFVNSYDNTTGGGDKSHAIYTLTANTAFTIINYNDYSVSGVQSFVGFLTSDRLTLADWQTATAQDVNSKSVAPVFISSTNLHLVTSSNPNLNAAATPIAGITVDLDGDTRNVTTPDMGADEFEPTLPCSITSAGLGGPTCNNNGTPSNPADDQTVFTLNPTGTGLGATYTVSVSSGSVTPTTGTYGAATTFTMQAGSAGSGGTVTVTVTDVTGGACSITAMFTQPASCSTTCGLTSAGLSGVTCNNNGTPSNPADDKTVFTLNPTGNNLGATYTVSVSSGSVTPTTGTYGAATTFTMQPGSAGSGGTVTVTVTDVTGGACSITAMFTQPASCSTTCGLTSAGLGGPTCNNNGTPSNPADDRTVFTLNPTGNNLGATYTVSVSSGSVTPTTGTYGAATTFTMQAGSAGSGGTVTVTVTDVTGGACSITAMFTQPASCSSNCSITSAGLGGPTCNNNGTPSNPADDKTVFTLNPTGNNLGATYTVSVSSGSVTPTTGTYGAATTFTMQAGSAGSGGTVTVTVTDVTGGACSITAMFTQPASCSTTCGLTSAGLSGVTCNNNGTPSNPADDKTVFTLNPTGNNLGATYTVSVSSGSVTPTTGTYGAATTFTMQAGSAGSGGTVTVTVTDVTGGACSITAMFTQPASCSSNCSITSAGLSGVTCNNNGTPSNPTDDRIVFTLNPTGTNLGATYTVSVSSGSVTPTTGTYGAATTFTMNAGSAGGANVTVTVTDVTGGGCSVMATITNPGSCSTVCNLASAGLSGVTCNNNGTPSNATDDRIVFQLNPTGTNLGATYTVSVSSGSVTPTTGTYGAATTFTMNAGSAGGANVTVTVTDASGSPCSIMATVTNPGSCSSSCALTSAGLSGVTCNNNGTPSNPTDDRIVFTLNPTGTNLGATYTVSVSSGSVTPTTGTYGAATTFTMNAGSAGGANVTVTVTDVTGGGCSVMATITNPGSCSTVCNLASAGLSGVTCNNNGTPSNATDDRIVFQLNPTGTNLGATYTVSVSSGSVTPTTGTYGAATTFTMNAGSAGGANVTVTVTDASGSPCSIMATVTNPGSCSSSCALTSAGLSGVTCNGNSTPSNPVDDRIVFMLNPTGTNLGATYTVSVSSGSVTPTTGTYGAATTFTMNAGSAGGGNVTVTVTNTSNGGCTVMATVTDPGSCSTTCGISAITVSNISSCNSNGTPNPADDTFTANVTVSFTNKPATGTLNLTGSGTASVPVGSMSGTSHTFTGVVMSANGAVINLTATFSANGACTFNNPNAGTAPVSCSPCSITGISTSNISACNNQGTANPADDTFTASVTVTFFNKPASGTLNLSGSGTASVAVGSISGSSHTFTGVVMSSNGAAINLTATFSANSACTFNNPNAGTAPASCSPCGISSIVVSNASVCDPNGTTDPVDDFFTANVTVNYLQPPASGSLNLSGSGTASTTAFGATSHTFVGVSMPANGGTISLTASFSANPACTLTNSNAGTAPSNCSGNCFINLVGIAVANESCPGTSNGAIVINANGSGTLGYSINGGASFQFVNTFNNLPPGIYVVVVKVFGTPTCSVTQTVTVGTNSTGSTWYKDMDNDNYSDGVTVFACTQPTGFKLAVNLLGLTNDCNDNDPLQFPGQTWYRDFDNDGYSNGSTLVQCNKPSGYKAASQLIATSGDCNDDNAAIRPGATEVCNGIDDNCDGLIDNGVVGGQTYVGNVTFYTQAEVNAWPACYSVIQGLVLIKNSGITSLAPLANIVQITGNVTIELTSLTSLNGLGSLTTIGGTLIVRLNMSLTSLAGLNNVTSVGGALQVYRNFNLTACCAIYTLINTPGAVVGGISIYLNKTTCDSVAAINAACSGNIIIPIGNGNATVANLDKKVQQVNVYPNPVSDELNVNLSKAFDSGTYRLFDLQGKVIVSKKLDANTQQFQIKTGHMTPGAYMLHLVIDGDNFTEKLIVE